MKKLVFSVIALTAFSAITFFNTSCSGSGEADNKENNDSTTVMPGDTATIDREGFASNINIRYVDMTLLMEKYNYAVQETARLQKTALELEKYRNSRANELQKMQNDIVQKQNNNGYFTQESYEKDMKDYYAKAQSAEAAIAKKAQSFDAEAAQVQATILKAIDNFIVKYNKEKRYDAILHKDAGLYFNPALDITQEIIDGLNADTQAADKTETSN